MLFHTSSWLPWIVIWFWSLSADIYAARHYFLPQCRLYCEFFPVLPFFWTPSRIVASTLHILETAHHQAVVTDHKASLRLTTFTPNLFYLVLNETEGRTSFWFIPLWIQTKYCNQHNSCNLCLQCYMFRFNEPSSGTTVQNFTNILFVFSHLTHKQHLTSAALNISPHYLRKHIGMNKEYTLT